MEKENIFVGREQELVFLNNAFEKASKGNGSFVFVEGEAGMGKTFLIKHLEGYVQANLKFEHLDFIYGYCYQESGEENAYFPFVEILETLLKTETEAKETVNAVLSIVKEVGADWLNLIPGFGPAVNAGIKTVSAIGQIYADAPTLDYSKNLVEQYTKIISRIAAQYTPLVLVIEDAHWLDSASNWLLMRLARAISDLPLLVIISYRSSYVAETFPFHSTKRELLAKDVAQVVSLTGLVISDIRAYLHKRFSSSLDSKFSRWIYEMCKGHPLFLTQYLSFLEKDGIIQRSGNKVVLKGSVENKRGVWKLNGQISTTTVPVSIEMLLEQRISQLLQGEKELLRLGSVQGIKFMSLVLAELTDKKEVDVLQKMHGIVEQHRIVEFVTDDKELLEISEVYAFEHSLMQQAFYKKMSPREQVIYHGLIAEILENMLKETGLYNQRVVLEIGNHYDLAHKFLPAAKYYFSAAQHLFSAGALVEAVEICERALVNIRLASGSSRLHGEIIELLLVVTEHRWHLPDHEQNKLQVFKLIEEGERVARENKDNNLLSKIRYLSGIFTLFSVNFAEGVKVMQEALELSDYHDDPISRFIIMSNLGYWMRAGNFAAGLEMQRSAFALYKNEIEQENAELSPQVRRQLYIIQRQLGVAEFDQGNLGLALSLLEQSLSSVRQIQNEDDLIPLLNGLAQIYMAIGFFPEAEAALKEALQLSSEDDPHTWNAYNMAMLGKVYLESMEFEKAYQMISEGLERSKKTIITWQLPLIRTLYAELLISPLSPYRNLDEAERQLHVALDEAAKYNLNRSIVVAQSLLGLLYWYSGDIKSAFEFSNKAISRLGKFTNLPAIRREEIYFVHYQVSKAAGDLDIALKYIKMAYTVLEEKALSLSKQTDREAFLSKVPLNINLVSERKQLKEDGIF
ncbi:MAG: DUF2791 family P-loop domain-containing protein [Anaerolineae bacterium]|jgi:tetratricopeptide (TPR) repeat protein|nr:DUF2791 family P-loop domain-containing protein [Anaerolineae bacterium]MBT7326362.1 DUF2791 family P-loop domain-containing protein [Anaerolineae bacterium]